MRPLYAVIFDCISATLEFFYNLLFLCKEYWYVVLILALIIAALI